MSRQIPLLFAWICGLSLGLAACTAVTADEATVPPTRTITAIDVAATDTAVPDGAPPTPADPLVAMDTAVIPTDTSLPVPPTDPSATPAPVCTPPACTEAEVYFCPGDCPGGCGTVCATPTPDNMGPAPTSWRELEAWLVQAWQVGLDPRTANTRLQAAGWQHQLSDMTVIDINDDGRWEWVMTLYPPEQGAVSSPVMVGNLWAIGTEGVFYRAYPEDVTPQMGQHLAPVVVDFAIMTGEAPIEMLINREMCGAHTCFGQYQILHWADGTLQNIVVAPPTADQPAADTITTSFPEIEFADYDGDGLADLLIHGGTIGSAGAGLVRTYTEVWSWDGTAVILADVILDPTPYRHHILYEANDAFAAADLNHALALYEQAINDTSLLTPPPLLEGTEADVQAAINQFAAFRLILIDLWREDQSSAAGRLTWLEANYPDTPITQAAQTFLADWTSGEDPLALCDGVTAVLQTGPDPTGPLQNMGYGNPSLTAVDVCPTEIEE